MAMATTTGINICILKYFMAVKNCVNICSLRVKGTACTETYPMYVTLFYIKGISVDLFVYRRST